MSQDTIEKPHKKSIWIKSIIAIVVLAIIASGVAFYFIYSAERHVKKFLALNHVSYDSLVVDKHRNFVALNAKIKVTENDAIDIQSIKGDLSLLGEKSKNITLENVHFVGNGNDISIPSIQIHDYVGKKAVSNKDTPYLVGNAVASIGRIEIPTINIDNKAGDYKNSYILHNVVYENIKNAIIGKATMDDATFSTSTNNDDDDSDDPVSIKTGKWSLQNVNIDNIAKIYARPPDESEENNQSLKLYDAWSVNDILIIPSDEDTSSEKVSIKKISGDKISMKFLPLPLRNFMDTLHRDYDNETTMNVFSSFVMKNGAAFKSSSDDLSINIDSIVLEDQLKDFKAHFDNITVSGDLSINMDGIALEDELKDFKAHVSNITLSYEGDILNKSITDFTFESGNTVGELKHFSISGLNYQKLAYALTQKWQRVGDDETSMEDTDYGDSILQFKTIHLDGLKVNSSDEEDMWISLDNIDVNADFTSGIIPKNLHIDMQGFTIPADDTFPNTQLGKKSRYLSLKELGYQVLKSNFKYDSVWNSDDKSLKIDLAYSIDDMGQFSCQSTLLNVNETIFSANKLKLIAAPLIGVAIKSLDTSINLDGYLKKYEKYDTANGGKFKEERHKIATQASPLITSLLGEAKSAKIGGVMHNYIENGGTLNIHQKAKSADGIGFVDFIIAENDPLSLLNKIDITADVQQ